MGCPKWPKWSRVVPGRSAGNSRYSVLGSRRSRLESPGGLDIEGAFPYAGTAMAVVCPDYV
jgi:hypothetical protein